MHRFNAVAAQVALLVLLAGCGPQSDTTDGTSGRGQGADVLHEEACGLEARALPETGPELLDMNPDPADERAGFESFAPEVTDSVSVDATVADVALLPDIADVTPGDAVEELATDLPQELPPELTEEVDPEPIEILIAFIDEPEDGTVFEEGSLVTLAAFAEDTLYAPAELVVTFTSQLDGELWSGSPGADNMASFNTTELSAGEHTITMIALSPTGESKEDSIALGICAMGLPETFDSPLPEDVWPTYGDAYWDAEGWLDMTGNAKDKQGAMFKITEKVNAGDVFISFKIQTGPNKGTGADGFAMTVYDAADVLELEALIAAAHGGGGLGYGVSGPYGPAVIDALHVEIDTWHNIENGNTELHTDPTSENHIAVCLNGDPGNCVLWAEVPDIEDLEWHDVSIEIEGYHITVTLDGATVLDEDVPGFEFRGGYIGFSGSTGYYSNYHRFDDLWVVQECVVP